jgi:hypothetical protein
MKIYSMEVETDLGRRVVKLAGPLDIEPWGEMPARFRSLTDLLWNVICEIHTNASQYAPPKGEA